MSHYVSRTGPNLEIGGLVTCKKDRVYVNSSGSVLTARKFCLRPFTYANGINIKGIKTPFFQRRVAHPFAVGAVVEQRIVRTTPQQTLCAEHWEDTRHAYSSRNCTCQEINIVIRLLLVLFLLVSTEDAAKGKRREVQ